MQSILKILLILFIFFPAQVKGNQSLNDLSADRDMYQNVVNDHDIWCVPEYFMGFNDPFIPINVVKERIWQNLPNIDYSTREAEFHRRVASIQEYSDSTKDILRTKIIPQLEAAIQNHPDYWGPPTPPIDFVNPVGYQCPEQNPGSQLKNKFNNSGNGNYLQCNYFQDGKLEYQCPYKSRKKNGIQLSFKGKRPHLLGSLQPYMNGNLHGTVEHWNVDPQSGHHWQVSKQEYSNGRMHGETISYRQNGTFRYSSMYNHGKQTGSCSYRENGSLIGCKSL